MATGRRVLMVVDNAVVSDARVMKTARTVAGLGHNVLVLGRRPRRPVRVRDEPFRVKLVRVRWRHPEPEAITFVGRHPFAYRTPAQAQAGRTADASAWQRFRTRRFDRALVATKQEADRLTARAADLDPEHLVAKDEYWRALRPLLIDFEDAYAGPIRKFRPDVIHAHDYRTIGIAVRAARRMQSRGRAVKVVYDAHEFLPGMAGPPGDVAGNAFYEASHIRLVDRIVTVSEPLARLLQDHHRLSRTPAVTLNAPEAEARGIEPTFVHDVRSDCGLPPQTPLIVYSGGVAPHRGLATVVAGLERLPEVHLAIIANRDAEGRALIAQVAEDHDVAHRIHMLDFVPRERIIQHLATADVAVHPLPHLPNHEIALPNKFFDYVFAGIPMVVSDVAHLSSVVTENDLGRSFVAGDPAAFAEAASAVLADLPRFRAAVAGCPQRARWTWEAQESVLADVYEELTS